MKDGKWHDVEEKYVDKESVIAAIEACKNYNLQHSILEELEEYLKERWGEEVNYDI